MSVSGFTPPRVSLNTPSTGTSSGSVATKQPDAQRQKLEQSASCSVPVPSSTAGLVMDLRRCEQEQTEEDADAGVPVVPGSTSAGAKEDDDFQNKQADDTSDLEAVGSSSSELSDNWHPKPREATLEGPSFEDFSAQLNNNLSEDKAPTAAKEEKPEKEEDALETPHSPPAGGSDKLQTGRTSAPEPWSGEVQGPHASEPSDDKPNVSEEVKLESSPAVPEASPVFPVQSPELSSDVYGFKDVF